MPLSEPLFLLFLILGLGGARKLEEGGATLRDLFLFLVLFGSAFLTRTVGLAVALGTVAALALAGAPGRAGLVILGASVLAVPWLVWSSGATGDVPAPMRAVLGPYGGWLLAEALRDPVLYAGLLGDGVVELTRQAGSLLVPRMPAWVRWSLLCALAPALLTGAWSLWRRSRALVLSLSAYVAAVWLWPFRDLRLLAPLLPFATTAVLLGAVTLLTPPPSGRWFRLRRGLVLPVAVWAVAFVGATGWSVWRGEHGARYRVRTETLERAAVAVSRHVPPRAVVGAPEMWAAIHLYTGRTVAPSARFLPLAREGPSWGTPEQQFELWWAAGVEYLLAEHGGGVHGRALQELERRCSGAPVELLELTGSGSLVRLDWDEACRMELGLGRPRGG